MFGMMGRFLPAGAAALMLSNPVTVGIGAVFAGMQLADAHKRKIALRRQQARSNVRQFLDEVQFAISNEICDVMRDVQRSIRDEFTERVGIDGVEGVERLEPPGLERQWRRTGKSSGEGGCAFGCGWCLRRGGETLGALVQERTNPFLAAHVRTAEFGHPWIIAPWVPMCGSATLLRA